MQLVTRRVNKGKSRVLLLREEDIPKVTFVWRVDEDGREYLPLCRFSVHPGIVYEGHQVCERRECRHYKRLYREEVR